MAKQASTPTPTENAKKVLDRYRELKKQNPDLNNVELICRIASELKSIPAIEVRTIIQNKYGKLPTISLVSPWNRP
jgi:hypothetical protein